MSAKKTDISQIKKYLDGKLDARAMHELEKQALNDPFLMDALEGYEHSGKSQQAGLDDLSKRLQQRTHRKKRVIMWPAMAAAASVLLFIGIGAWWLLYSPSQKQVSPPKSHIVKTKPDTQPVHQTDSTESIALQPTSPKIRIRVSGTPSFARAKKHPLVASNEDLAAAKSSSKNADTAKSNMLNEVTIVGHQLAERKASVTASVSGIGRQDTIGIPLAGRIAGLEVSKRKGRPGATDKIRIRGIAASGTDTPLYVIDGVISNDIPKLKAKNIVSVNVLKDASATAIYGSRAAKGVVIITTKNGQLRKSDSVNNLASRKSLLIRGQVLSKANKQPLPGVRITIPEKNSETVTDSYGRFTIKAEKNDLLNFGYMGFYNQQVKVKNRDSLKVLLNEHQNSLSEVAVIGYCTQNNEETTGDAHPAGGWNSFRQYLKNNAASPDGKAGVVQLTFIVNTDNHISDITIIKSLSAEADQKAIELIKNGPAWLHNGNGKPEKIRVRIRFRN